MKYLITLFLLLVPLTAYPTNYGSDANCQGYWGMEYDGNETAVTGTDLTETSGDIPQSADAQYGDYSRDFERGDSEYLEHADGNETDISGADQAISLVAFSKPEATDSNWRSIMGKYKTSGNDRQYAFINKNGVINVYLSSTGSDYTTCTGGTDNPDGSWYHFAFVYDDTDMRIYVDGSLDSNGASNPKTYSSGIADKASPFRVGDRGDGSGYGDGLLDDVAVFDRALTSVEVSDISTNGIEGSAVARRIIKVVM